ncbi:uncharacterized protein J3D65DRAFT_140860 [Phyllosticta citribraziliensis]|uniref:Uncharacterized protein n=1 Tax=Phyllosticta citribraziliensis TaxID=989973 RepID=A0ABR1L874_9PEZI
MPCIYFSSRFDLLLPLHTRTFRLSIVISAFFPLGPPNFAPFSTSDTMSDERSAARRTMETALVVFKDPRLELHHPVPSQPKEIVAMRHLARYEQPDDNATSSSTLTATTAAPATPAQHRRAPDHGEPPAAGYFAHDFSWRAEFGARPDWCPGQDPEPEPEPETSSVPLPLTPDADLFDGLYGVGELPKRIDSAAYVSQGGQQHQQHHQQPQEHERSQVYASGGQGHGASQTYAYAGQAHGASQSRPRHHHYEEYRPSYSDGDYECSFFSRRSAAPPAATTATSTSHHHHQQDARRHQPSNSLVLRNVHGQDRLSPFEWRVFNETRIHEDE